MRAAVAFQVKIAAIGVYPVLLLEEGINGIQRNDKLLIKQLPLHAQAHTGITPYASLRIGKPVICAVPGNIPIVRRRPGSAV